MSKSDIRKSPESSQNLLHLPSRRHVLNIRPLNLAGEREQQLQKPIHRFRQPTQDVWRSILWNALICRNFNCIRINNTTWSTIQYMMDLFCGRYWYVSWDCPFFYSLLLNFQTSFYTGQYFNFQSIKAAWTQRRRMQKNLN